MEKNVLRDLGMNNRSEVVTFLKSLWNGKPAPCPKCGFILELLHKKAKKSNCDWKCPNCYTVYKAIHILDELNEIVTDK